MFELVHIPKTGGTALGMYLLANYPKHFTRIKPNSNHRKTASECDNPICVIREPTDRLLSMYSYYQNGSDLFKIKNKISFLDFINEIKISNGSFFSKAHMLPQSYWLKEKDYNKTIIIKYKNNLNEIVDNLLNICGINNEKKARIERCNVTNKKEEIRSFDEIILNKYKDDFELWDKINNQKSLFRAVI